MARSTSTQRPSARRRFVTAIAALSLLSGLVVALDAAPASATATNWSAVPSTGPSTNNALQGISCVGIDFCTAVGVRSDPTIEEGAGKTLIEQWDGTAWSTVASPNPDKYNNLEEVSCASTTFCAAVGWFDGDTGRHTLIEIWDDGQWSVVPSPDAAVDPWIAHNELYGVSCVTATFCVAVGDAREVLPDGSGSEGQDFGTTGLIAMWNGSSWSLATAPEAGYFRGVSCTSTTFCIAGRLKWNGIAWTDTGSGGSAVSCVSPTFCVATASTTFRIWNGTAWSNTPRAGTGSIQGVACVSETLCAAVGGRSTGDFTSSTIAEAWNGVSWSVEPTPDVGDRYNALSAVSCPTAELCLAVGWWSDDAAPQQQLVLSASVNERPWPPVIGTVTPKNASVSVPFSAASDGGSPILHFTAQCSSDGNSVERSASGTTSPILVTGLTNGRSYRCRVTATNAIGTGVPSLKSNRAVPATIPTAPTSPSALPGNGSATVKWTRPASDGGSAINGYLITPYLAGVAQPVRTFNGAATTQVVTGLTKYKSYTFRIAARNAWGLSQKSVATAPILVGVPTAPTNVRASGGDRRALVSWTAPAGNGGFAITGYAVTPYVGTTAQPQRLFSSTATSEMITGLTNGTAYSFKVTALNANGTGMPSAPSLPVTVGAPGAPTAVTATAGPSRATVHWTAPANNGAAITGSVITPYKAGVAQPPRNFASAATTQVVTGLTPGASYTFKVAAKNARGTGPQSAASNAAVPS